MRTTEEQLRIDILNATIAVFQEKGLKFTMDDLAKQQGISKKTIYTVFPHKDDLFLAMVDYLFDGIKESEAAVVADESLTTVEKLRRILGVMPDSYEQVDFRKLYVLKDKYPAIYERVEERLETGWETTLALMEQGIREGVIRPVKLPLVKMMMEASLEQFFQRDILVRTGITYAEGLQEVVNILVDGILTNAGSEQ